MDHSTVTTLPHVHQLGYRCGMALAQWWHEIAGPDRGGVSDLSYNERLWSLLTSTLGSSHWWSSTVLSAAAWQELGRRLLSTVIAMPGQYRTWWWHLVRNDPIHVFVETTLLLSILYILVSRSYDWRELEKIKRDELSPREENELIHEWKLYTRAPLVPPISAARDNHLGGFRPNDVVVHKTTGRTMDIHIEGDVEPGPGAGETLVDDVHGLPPLPPRVRTVLNFATFDFLGMSCDDVGNMLSSAAKSSSRNGTEEENVTVFNDSDQNPLKAASRLAMTKYGCGSCGPRGFYGTMDVHLQMEQEFARYLGTDNSIMYSDGASTCSSTIAAFAKRGDLLVVDEGINEALRTGVTLSRAHVKWFQHNDMEDLQRVLQQVQVSDKQIGRKLNAQRRFIVVEGLYRNTGAIVPLDVVVKLKHEFSYRLILDESLSFGTLGPTGRGVTELCAEQNIRYMHDVEIVTISLENSVGSIGGITLGNDEIVDQQRISGSGYCFSASTPPFAAAAALAALDLMQKSATATIQAQRSSGPTNTTSASMFDKLKENCRYLHQQLRDLCTHRLDDVFLVTSDNRSPLVLLQVADIPETENLNEVAFLQAVNKECLLMGAAFVVTGSSSMVQDANQLNLLRGSSHGLPPPTQRGVAGEPPPGIRLTVSAAHTFQDIDDALRIFGDAVDVVMNRLHGESSP